MSSSVLRRAREQRGGGNNQPTPISGNTPGMRPNTSIRGMQPQQPVRPRMATAPQPQIRQIQKEYNYSEPQPTLNSLPFNKLTIPDAIGLITLRLGRVEQFMIDMEENTTNSLPHSKMDEFAQRITLLENTPPTMTENINTEILDKQMVKIQEQVDETHKNINKEMQQIKQNELKYKEEILKLTRNFTEMGDSIKSFISRYDILIQEINEKFTDFEFAFSEIEKQINNVLPPNQIIPEKDITLSEIYTEDNLQIITKSEETKEPEEVLENNISIPLLTKEELTDILKNTI